MLAGHPEPGWLLADNENKLTKPQVDYVDTAPFSCCVLVEPHEPRWLLADNENKLAKPQVECVDTAPFSCCVLAKLGLQN